MTNTYNSVETPTWLSQFNLKSESVPSLLTALLFLLYSIK